MCSWGLAQESPLLFTVFFEEISHKTWSLSISLDWLASEIQDPPVSTPPQLYNLRLATVLGFYIDAGN